MQSLTPPVARHALAAGVVVTVIGALLAVFLIQGYAPAPLAIGTSINSAPGGVTLPGFGVGSFSSCIDTDNGNDPSDPGATIVVISGAPTVNGSARPILDAISSATPNYSLGQNGGNGYDITYTNNGRQEKAILLINRDRGSSATTYSNDQPVTSEPGAGTPNDQATSQAVLAEHYCYCVSSTSTPPYQYCSDNSSLYIGTLLDSDFIDYPRAFERFMQGIGFYFPTDADYLIR
ncbi:MAG: hypothetical protein IPJ89_02500 [Candidatus Iainarchaeum archaeon]|uniref:Uncharacterized protein n=1 Tax=Candidatus Iainarchaeum sp. TaxID=3101447 RepID=A0A7T9DKN5_9ARCH|nr:MAG: hypothetical protein IPJ89_02500 [Candidatus Diapherotrites archaeon]